MKKSKINKVIILLYFIKEVYFLWISRLLLHTGSFTAISC